MSRLKKSRSLKRVTGGVKTGSKERTKLENKQRKAKQKAANPMKGNRQRSVYQKFLDENEIVEKQHPAKPIPVKEIATVIKAKANTKAAVHKAVEPLENSESLWDQLEKPTNNDTF
ncbi:MAG: hypothetical protein ACI8SR_002055 [Oceanicoccus sp.]|jgi:hypothetical protein